MARLTNLRPRIEPMRVQRVSTLTVDEHVRMSGSLWARLRREVLTAACGLCQCQECSEAKRLRLAHEVDHTVPLWRGGTDARSNLQAINRDCHKRKTAREATERARGGG